MVVSSTERRGFSRRRLMLAALLVSICAVCLTGCAVVTDQLARATTSASAEPERQPREQILGRWRCNRSTIIGDNQQTGVELVFLDDGTFRYMRPGEESTREGTYRLSRDGTLIQIWYTSRAGCQTLDVELEGDALLMRGAAYDRDRGWLEFENEYSRID